MGVYLRGRWYWYQRTIDGRRYLRSLNIHKGQELLLSEAVRIMDEQITAEHLGIPYNRPTAMTFSAFADKYHAQEEGQVSDGEWKKKRQRLAIVKDVWGSIPLNALDRAAVLRLERFLLDTRKISETTVNRYFEILRHMFRRAIEDGLVRESPIRFFTPYREDGCRRALTSDEINRIIRAAADLTKSPRSQNYKPILDLILFGLHTGARLSECLKLRFENIRDRESLAVLPINETKSKRRVTHQSASRVKVIALNSVARAAVEKYRQGRTVGIVFPFTRQDECVIEHPIAAIRKAANVPDFTFHLLRHTLVTEASERFGLTTARNIVSHADIKTTARYTHPHLEEIQAAVTKLTTIFPGYEAIKKRK